MATSYTGNVKLGMPAVGDRGWNLVVNANAGTLDALTPVGGLCVSPVEVPSASLNVRVAPGSIATPWGSRVDYAGAASQALSPSVVNFLWLTTAGVLTTGSAWPSTAHVPLAVVTAGPSTILGVTDARVVCAAVVPGSQPASANQAAITDSTGGTDGTAVSNVGSSFSQATLNNNFATILGLLNQLRNDLVTLGLIKGSA